MLGMKHLAWVETLLVPWIILFVLAAVASAFSILSKLHFFVGKMRSNFARRSRLSASELTVNDALYQNDFNTRKIYAYANTHTPHAGASVCSIRMHSVRRYMVVGLCEESVSCGRNRPARYSPADAVRFPPLWPVGRRMQPAPDIARSHWPVGPNRALCDLPQIILAAYFLSKSFGDCLPEEGVPVPGVCKLTTNFLIEARFNNCKLTAKSALMILLSLATSAAYFGCTHATNLKRPLQTSVRDVSLKCRTKLVCLCRQSRANPAHRRTLARGERARRASSTVQPG